MNLLLLTETELVSASRALVTDPRQLEHLIKVLKVSEGDLVTVGVLDGKLGTGKIIELSAKAASLQLDLHSEPPTPLPLTLILALPRPQQIKRILQTVAGAGIKQVHLIQTRRVEKSYWQSPSVTSEAIQQQLCLGLEQARDTVMPEVHCHRRFRPFVEDTLASLMSDALALLAHPYTQMPCPAQVARKTILAVGPEGGFNEYETEQLIERGFQPVHLGPRILKTEIAIPFLLGRLF